MKKILLSVLLSSAVCSAYVLAGQGGPAFKGGSSGTHEAKFKVLEYATKKPIANAALCNTVDKQLGTTNKQGTLVISLPASASDIYVIKSEGYVPTQIRLTKAELKSASYEVLLKAKTPAQMDRLTPITADATVPSVEPDLVKVYVKQDPATYQKPSTDQSSRVEFAVQLSATSRPITDKSSLKTWEELGPVYVHAENGLYKVRIGPFDTQEGAKAVLLQAKARGKKDAFIVVQQGIENHQPYEFKPLPADDTPVAEKKQATPRTQPAPKETVTGDYKVRLASYLHPGGFNTKDVDQYGPLESYRQGEWTIMLIGGIKTKADAERIRNSVVAKGYTDARVVVDMDGILIDSE